VGPWASPSHATSQPPSLVATTSVISAVGSAGRVTAPPPRIRPELSMAIAVMSPPCCIVVVARLTPPSKPWKAKPLER
jgi:hypothetical protein